MPFTIIRNDISKMEADAIVNAANTNLLMGSGVCGAIFKAAGRHELQAACDKLAPIRTGEAVITPGFNLPAKFVIHAAGPVYNRQSPQESERLLHAAYSNALKCAAENNCESIAFPLISSGIYGYPKLDAWRVATSTIQNFLADYDMDVSLVVFDKAAFAVSEELWGAVESYIDEHYVEERTDRLRRSVLLQVEAEILKDAASAAPEEISFRDASKRAMPQRAAAQSLDALVGKLDESFAVTLLRLIDASGKSDAEVYKRANIDRRLFSKIRSNLQYVPSKPTVLAFAIALELTLVQTKDLLARAGFALSRSRKFDVIVEYFIASGRYDVFEINEVLFHYDQTLLGG